ncbi:OmpA family protein [Rhabdochromatium marinum]|uniref:OmpA family protein n=1 Tax=Rhabdochromatium marinum TaxID=48729 RepID=UPI001908C1DF
MLQPSIEQSIQTLIERDSKRFADVLFPVMGPAIRKAINAAIQGMFNNLNQLMEQSLSPQSFLWRIEAWRTGEPFAKIALLRTLVFQIEQIFLVHAETGLLIGYAQREDAITRDPDMVSSMLTAIQDFVADSFAVGDDESLSAMAYGNLKLVIHKGPYAVLASAIRGNHPDSVEELLSETIETLHRLHGRELRSFSGDMEHFPDFRPQLTACLMQQRQGRTERRKPWLAISILGLAALLIALLSIGYNTHQWRLQRQQQDVITQLNQAAGYVVINTKKQDNDWIVSGLRDPLARAEATLLDAEAMEATAYVGDWRPYFSLDPEIVKKRAMQQLKIPNTVSVQLEDRVLTLTGRAPSAWIDQLHHHSVPGIDRIETQALLPTRPAHWQAWQQLLVQLQAEPGYIVTESGEEQDGYRLHGFKDPIAREIEEIAGDDIYQQLGVQATWETYYSTEPDIVLKRVTQALNIPDTVTPQLSGERLVLTGKADQRWVAKVANWPHAIAGISDIDVSAVAPLDADVQAYENAVRALNATRFYFASAQATIAPDRPFLSAIKQVRDHYRMLSVKAPAIGQTFRIGVSGYTDNLGGAQRNQELRQERAQFIRDQLVEAGIPRDALFISHARDVNYPLDPGNPLTPSMRRVELRVQTAEP